jgi:hypothetical protein
MRDQFIEARRRGVPLIAITTADQPDLTARLALLSKAVPCVCWDAVRGLFGINEAGSAACSQVLGDASPAMFTDAPAALDVASTLPGETLVVMQGAHRLVAEGRCAQGILNLRDPFAATRRCLVLLGPSFSWPAELGSDVLAVDDPLPTERERARMIGDIATSAEVQLEEGVLREAVRATRGLSAFVTQQVSALAMQRTGMDLRALRAQWRRAINDTPGLSVDESGTTLDDVAGLGNFKSFCTAVMGGRGAPDTIVRIDEIEKAMGGSTSDSSGVSQAILGGLLTWMQEKSATGLIALGPPGSGKSLSSVAMGSVRGAPTVTLDIGALKGSLVGQSEERTRSALRTLESLAGRTFWIATCNSLSALPPELRRRFGFGVWFFDLPTEQERDAIWKMYLQKYNVPDARPQDEGWTGAEIRSACEFAFQLGITPQQAAQWIVPVSLSSPEVIDDLRRRAAGRFMSASYPGPYRYKGASPDVAVAVVRRFELGGTPDKEKN